MTVRNKQNHLKYKNVITIKLTDIELNIVNRTASMAGLSRSEYIRQLILNGTVPVTYEIVADMDDLKKLVSEYGKIGSNLNQIAKYFNTGGMRALSIEDEIHQCIADLFKLRKKFWKWQVIQMAVLKHIKSRNANYSDAIDYLLFQHDENTGKKILDESGRPILREAYYIDGLYVPQNLLTRNVRSPTRSFVKIKKLLILKAIITL